MFGIKLAICLLLISCASVPGPVPELTCYDVVCQQNYVIDLAIACEDGAESACGRLDEADKKLNKLLEN